MASANRRRQIRPRQISDHDGALNVREKALFARMPLIIREQMDIYSLLSLIEQRIRQSFE
jgi:hypothetical protein